MAVFNMAIVGMLPTLILAQDMGTFSPSSDTATTQQKPQFAPPPSGGDPQQCINDRCVRLKQDCIAKVGDNKDAMAQCERAVNDCVASCQGRPPMPNDADKQRQFSGDGVKPDGFPEKSQEQMDAKMQEMQKRQLDIMRKQIGGFAGQLNRVKARVAALAKKGVAAPQELTDALARADELVATIKAAESPEDVDHVETEMHDIEETVREHMPNLERLANMSKIYARVDKQIKLFDKQLAADKSLATRSKIDINSAVSDFETALASLKGAYAAAKAAITAGDIDEGFEMLENDVFDAMSDINRAHAVIQQIRQLQTTIKQGERDITTFQKQLDRFKKQAKDTAAAQTLLDEGKAKLAELKIAAAAKPLDTESIADLLDTLGDTKAAFMDALNDLKGVAQVSDIDQGLVIPKLDISGFGFSEGMTQEKPAM
jgi:DNA repair exonuclease SbcCD ATPase subunit